MSDKTEKEYQDRIRALEAQLQESRHWEKGARDKSDVSEDKMRTLQARVDFANETLQVAKAVNDKSAERISKLELELVGERQKNRSVGIQMELLVSTNAELRALLSKHVTVDPPQVEAKRSDEPMPSSKMLGLSSSDYYFDKEAQSEDKISRKQQELRQQIIELEYQRANPRNVP